MTAVDGLPASTAPSVPEVPDNLLAAPLVDLQPWEKLTGEPREFADDLEDLVSLLQSSAPRRSATNKTVP
ncbi:hypothetical protein BMF94_1434 [Rhodotorula taiwanensis]|uniref:Uncharacterized protein n=1 Tax=Rhodotorula taiwanensis TaxID=741276 RepID=A0A2S5BFJ4_9BASI|nr:hypothetical protein BMF94_1434 [Rhodotorula taiwanensis]